MMRDGSRGAVRVYFNRRMGALVAVGFASGLPLALTGPTLQAWMTDAGVTLTAIGLFALVKIPYNIKFIWAPLMDAITPPWLGRRRGWMLITQILLACSIAVMAFADPGQSLRLLAISALVVAFCSASYDIVADAYRTDVLDERESGAGAAVFITGYRIAYLISAAATLYLVGAYGVSWRTAYLMIAALMAVGIIATLLAPRPASTAPPPHNFKQAVYQPLAQFLTRPGGWIMLLFVIIFKLPDVMVDNMKTPFLLDIGVSKEDLAKVVQFMGMGATIIGTFAGGWLIAKMGIWKSLWVLGILQAVSNLGFLAMTWTGSVYGVLVIVIGIENFCAGMVTAGFVAFLMSQCDKRFSATQYAVLSGLMSVPRDIGGASMGWLAAIMHWGPFFTLSIIAAIPGLAMLWWIKPTQQTAPKISSEILPEQGASMAAAAESASQAEG